MAYDMRIVNRAKLNEHGCFPFSEESIKNIPNIDVFVDIDVNVNRLIYDGCIDVLRRSMSVKNKFRYGEQGLLISVVDRDMNMQKLEHINVPLEGEYHHIEPSKNPNYTKAVRNRKIKDLVFIHNHPNNSYFSGNDILNLTGNIPMLAMIAVGNRSNLFILIDEKKDKSAYKFILNYVNKMRKEHNDTDDKNDKKYRDEAAELILKEPEKYGLTFIAKRRKSK